MLPFLSFFEELEVDDEPTREAEPRRRSRMPRRGGGGDGDGDGGDGTNEGGGRSRTPGIQRLLVLVGVVLLVVAIGIWQVRRCQRDAEVSAHKSYVTDANALAKQSAAVGTEFSKVLIAPDASPDTVSAELEQMIKTQQQIVRESAELDGPGGLGDLQPWFLTAMQYRVSGLTAVREALEQAFTNQAKQAGAVSAEDAEKVSLTYSRLIASDVVYEDSYREPAKAELQAKNIEGVAVDPSVFLDAASLELASPKRMKVVLDAMLGGGSATDTGSTDGSTDTNTDTTGGTGKHGLSLESSTIVPTDKPEVQLSTTDLNEVDLTDEMILRVTVKNSGDFAEAGLRATAVIGDKTVESDIAALEAGQSETVDLPFSVDDVNPTEIVNITVTAEPVPDESNPDNNQSKYRVQFKFPA